MMLIQRGRENDIRDVFVLIARTRSDAWRQPLGSVLSSFRAL